MRSGGCGTVGGPFGADSSGWGETKGDFQKGVGSNPVPLPRDALEWKGPQRWPQWRLDRRLEEVAIAVGGGYCRLQMPLKLALGVRETAAGHRLGALEGGGGLPMHPCPPLPPPPPFKCTPGRGGLLAGPEATVGIASSSLGTCRVCFLAHHRGWQWMSDA